MVLPKWTRLLDRSKRQTFTQTPTPTDHLDSSLGVIDCNCKARKQVEKYYRYIGKRLDQLEYDRCQLLSEQNEINSRESQLSRSIWHLRVRERELDDYCAYLNDKRQSIDSIYNKCEVLETQINDRFEEYNNMQKDLKKKLDELDQRQNNLALKEQQIERISRDIEMRERELSIHQGKVYQERDNYQRMAAEAQQNSNNRSVQQCLMDIEHERRKLEMDRHNFSQYYESIMEEIDRKWRKLNKINDAYRDKEEDILIKEKQLLSNRENIQQAWNEIEEARIDIMKQKELLKRKTIAAEAAASAAMQNSISLQQQKQQVVNDDSTIDRRNESNRPYPSDRAVINDMYDPVYKETPRGRYRGDLNRQTNQDRDDQYRILREETSAIDPRIQIQLQEKMSDITKLVEDIKQETSLLAMEKYSLQGQKKQFELEKAINERELAAKEQHLLNLEQSLRKNDLIDQATPTTINGQLNGYYGDKMRLGDSSTRFTDVDRDIGGFFLDKSTENYPSSKRLNTRAIDLRNSTNNPRDTMRDIRDYGKVR